VSRRLVASTISVVLVALLALGCSSPAPAPTPTKAPAAPTKAAEPAKAAEPTKPAATTPAATKPTEPTPAPTAVPKTTEFPTKGRSITFIVPWGAGGPNDVGTRILSPILEKGLGVPVQVVNKAGAGGQVGMTEVALAKPDGYTLGAAALESTISAYLDEERKAAFDRKSLVPLALHVIDPAVIAVKADSPYRTVKDLVDAAKAKPNTIKAAIAGILGDDHQGFLKFQKAAGTQMSMVQFDSAAVAVTSLLGGHVDVDFGNVSEFPAHVKAGSIRVLAIMDPQENKFLPGVPTLESQGIRVYNASSRGVAVAAGTPKDVVDILARAIQQAMQSEEHVKKMDELFLTPRYMNPEQFATYWDQVEAEMKPVIAEFRASEKK